MWSRNKDIFDAPEISTWPTVISSALSEKSAQDFEKRREAIKLYFSGVNVTDIQRRTGVNAKSLPRLAKNCLALATDGRIFGFRALIPYHRIKPYTKGQVAGPKRREQQGGQSGGLGYVLDLFPDIELALKNLVRQKAKLHQVAEFNLKPSSLHRSFLDFLKEKIESREYPQHGWPFNTKYLGLRTIQKFMADLVGRNFSRSVFLAGQREAIAHTRVGRGHVPFLDFNEPYDAVEIDAYWIEAHSTVSFETPEGTHTDLRLDGLWYIAAICRGSTAILAHTVVYRSEVTADDVLRVIRNAVSRKWEPMQLTLPGLAYRPGAGFPSGTIDEAEGAVWSVTLLDGALAHLAEKIRERARKKLGFILNWGAVGHFERRPNVERTFKTLGVEIVRRLPSTTGSHPHKGRAPKAEENALKYKVRAADIEQLIEVQATGHNAIPTEGLSFLSPLEYIRYYLCGAEPICEVRRLPMRAHEESKKMACIERRRIRGSIKEGRRPYIQIDRVHYTSLILAEAAQLIGRFLILEIDEDDLRHVHAFFEDGSDFGILEAAGKWSVTKHSRRTRKAINSLISKRLLVITSFDDPMEIYLRYLSTPTQKSNKKRDTLTPRQATHATRIAKESGFPPKIQREAAKELSSTMISLTEVSQRRSLFRMDPNKPRMAKNRR